MKNHAFKQCESSKSFSFYSVFGPPVVGLNAQPNFSFLCFSLKAKNGHLGAIFALLGPSRQFVGDVKRGQDGAKIALKWSSRRLAQGKGASSISSRILRVLAPRRGPKLLQDRSQEGPKRGPRASVSPCILLKHQKV